MEELDGNPLTDTSEIEQMPEKSGNDTLSMAYKLLAIGAIVITVVLWLANVSSTASHADQISQQNSAQLQQKVDKDQFQQMQQDVRDIKNFLMNGKYIK